MAVTGDSKNKEMNKDLLNPATGIRSASSGPLPSSGFRGQVFT